MSDQPHNSEGADLALGEASPDQKKLALSYAFDARQKEIDRFWSRVPAFWAIVAAMFLAYGVLYQKAGLTLLVVACSGFVSSFVLALQSRGSKYWLEQWENKVAILETAALNIALISNREPREEKRNRWEKWFGAQAPTHILNFLLL